MRFHKLDIPFADEGYGCRIGRWSFVVSREGRTWTASWADAVSMEPRTTANIIGRYSRHDDAADACRAKLRQLRKRLS